MPKTKDIFTEQFESLRGYMAAVPIKERVNVRSKYYPADGFTDLGPQKIELYNDYRESSN